MALKTHMKLRLIETDFFRETPLPQTLEKQVKSSIFNFYWICSIMKIYIICRVPVHILHLVKILSLRYGTNCSLSIRLQYPQMSDTPRTNGWNSLIFSRLIQVQKYLNLIENVLGGHFQKWVWLFWSRDSEKWLYLQTCNKLIFCVMLQI